MVLFRKLKDFEEDGDCQFEGERLKLVRIALKLIFHKARSIAIGVEGIDTPTGAATFEVTNFADLLAQIIRVIEEATGTSLSEDQKNELHTALHEEVRQYFKE